MAYGNPHSHLTSGSLSPRTEPQRHQAPLTRRASVFSSGKGGGIGSASVSDAADSVSSKEAVTTSSSMTSGLFGGKTRDQLISLLKV